MNAKERKLKSDISERTCLKDKGEERIVDARVEMLNQDVKSRHVRSLTSNIFHEPRKDDYNKVFTPNVLEKLEETKEPKYNKVISPGKWDAKIDFKDSRYELIFRKEYEKISLDKKRDYKRNLNTSAPDIVTDDIINKEVKNNMIEVFRKYAPGNQNKLKQKLNLSSSFQGHEFYKNSYTINQSERPSNNYHIKVDDVDSINLKLFKKDFLTHGYIDLLTLVYTFME
jgi:hypothetical protein